METEQGEIEVVQDPEASDEDLAQIEAILHIEPWQMDGEQEFTVDARLLHAALASGKDFATWFRQQNPGKIWKKGRDFEVIPLKGVNPQGGRPRDKYVLSLRMATHIAMQSQCQRGYLVRDYFYYAERELRRSQQLEHSGTAVALPSAVPESLDRPGRNAYTLSHRHMAELGQLLIDGLDDRKKYHPPFARSLVEHSLGYHFNLASLCDLPVRDRDECERLVVASIGLLNNIDESRVPPGDRRWRFLYGSFIQYVHSFDGKFVARHPMAEDFPIAGAVEDRQRPPLRQRGFTENSRRSLLVEAAKHIDLD